MFQYLYNLILGLDQFINVLLLGDPDESISTRTSRSLRTGKPKWWVYTLAGVIDFLFYNPLWKAEKDHVMNSFEPDEKAKKELWKWYYE